MLTGLLGLALALTAVNAFAQGFGHGDQVLHIRAAEFVPGDPSIRLPVEGARALLAILST